VEGDPDCAIGVVARRVELEAGTYRQVLIELVRTPVHDGYQQGVGTHRAGCARRLPGPLLIRSSRPDEYVALAGGLGQPVGQLGWRPVAPFQRGHRSCGNGAELLAPLGELDLAREPDVLVVQELRQDLAGPDGSGPERDRSG